MALGFYHPSLGYWQTSDGVSQDIREGYPTGTIEVPLRPTGDVKFDGTSWVANVTSSAEALHQERLGMICSPLQGKLALGEAQWNKILEYRSTASWAEQVIIDSAQEWKRLSENIKFFQYLLNYTDEQVDDLFRVALTIEA